MNLLIFGDTHLSKFEPKKYTYLVKLIQKADKVIINGDFWDSWFTSFDSFIKSEWSKLFPLLLSKKTVYLYGNHDPEEKNDERVKYFSVLATNHYQFTWQKQKLIVTHNAKAVPHDFPIVLRWYQQILDGNQQNKIGTIIRYCIHIIEQSIYIFLGKKIIANNFLAYKLNLLQKKYKPKHALCIYGHTHRDEIDQESLYINSGSILYGYSSYLILNSSGIKLYQEKY